MKTQTLLKVSLVTSFIGLLFLFFLSENIEPKLIPISEINQKMFDEYVKISGKITSVRETDGLYILTIQDSSSEIEGIIYKQNNKIQFPENENMEIIGKVSEYRGQLQIEISEYACEKCG
ncbi:MAG: hypothetical protein KJ767_01565 [Nanoarchaeota archaeon]|nr:hypothetical protein [Nanoarchaeota archaeon]